MTVENATEASAGTADEPVHVEGQSQLDELVDTGGVVLADFYADWCGPCQMLEPVVEKLAAETDATVAKVDVDANQRLAPPPTASAASRRSSSSPTVSRSRKRRPPGRRPAPLDDRELHRVNGSGHTRPRDRWIGCRRPLGGRLRRPCLTSTPRPRGRRARRPVDPHDRRRELPRLPRGRRRDGTDPSAGKNRPRSSAPSSATAPSSRPTWTGDRSSSRCRTARRCEPVG